MSVEMAAVAFDGAENATAEELVSVVGAWGRQVLWQDLTDEQLEQLEQAAVPPSGDRREPARGTR